MVNVGLLRAKINERGVMFKHVAKKAGLSETGLWNKLRGDVDFRASELVGIRGALHLSDAEFLELFDVQGGEVKHEQKQG